MKITKQWPVYILSGGKSSRFGSDKARHIWQGKPLILHVSDELKSIAKSLTVIANQRDKYQKLGLKTIADIEPGLGPMSGIHTALIDSPEDWIFVTSCDLLGFDISWIHQLWNHQKDSQPIVFYSDYWEPLFAFYHKDNLSSIEECIKNRQLSLWRLLEQVEAIPCPHPVGWKKVKQVNKPGDLI